MIEYKDQQGMLEWAHEEAGFYFRSDAFAIGWKDTNGKLKAVTIMEDFDKQNCMIHLVSDQSVNWFNRYYIKFIFNYLFKILGLRRVTATVPVDNQKALSFDTRMGFQVEGMLRKAEIGDVDMVIFGMLREECKWIKQENYNG